MVALGRRVEHDPRSRNYPARKAIQPRSVLWRHRAPVLDQGDLGSCVGNALAQCLNTTYFAHSRRRYLTEAQARSPYSLATQLDEFPGQWPTDDTGSSGLAVCKAGVQLGYLTEYRHSFGFDHFAATLQTQPLLVGTDWTEDMFHPARTGFVEPTGDVVGGHEYVALGINHRTQMLTFLNSWSAKWGRNGRFRMRFDAFNALLANQGDATAPTGR